MLDIAQNTADGIMVGSAYALLAIGFTLIFGVMRRLNLAYGPAIMVGLFAGVFVHETWRLGLVEVAAATIVGSVVAGAYVERICFGSLRRGAVLAPMVASFAIWMQLEEAVTLVFPGRTYSFPALIDGGAIEIGPLTFRSTYLAMFGCALIIMAGLNLLLHKTRFGLALRSVSTNPDAARHIGLNVGATIFWAFVLASIIGGIGGFLAVGAEGTITPKFGLWATIKGLIAMMLGGVGSVAGAVVGGFLLGIVEANATWYLGAEFRDIVAYLLLLAFLVLRPGGLLGRRHAASLDQTARRV